MRIGYIAEYPAAQRDEPEKQRHSILQGQSHSPAPPLGPELSPKTLPLFSGSDAGAPSPVATPLIPPRRRCPEFTRSSYGGVGRGAIAPSLRPQHNGADGSEGLEVPILPNEQTPKSETSIWSLYRPARGAQGLSPPASPTGGFGRCRDAELGGSGEPDGLPMT